MNWKIDIVIVRIFVKFFFSLIFLVFWCRFFFLRIFFGMLYEYYVDFLLGVMFVLWSWLGVDMYC